MIMAGLTAGWDRSVARWHRVPGDLIRSIHLQIAIGATAWASLVFLVVRFGEMP
jgi:hypothetical protein